MTEVIQNPVLNGKFRHDGSHFYMIQKTTSINAGKERSPSEQISFPSSKQRGNAFRSFPHTE